MEFRAEIEETDGDRYRAWCSEPAVEAWGLSPANALDRLRAELRYWVELCPCSGIGEDEVELSSDP